MKTILFFTIAGMLIFTALVLLAMCVFKKKIFAKIIGFIFCFVLLFSCMRKTNHRSQPSIGEGAISQESEMVQKWDVIKHNLLYRKDTLIYIRVAQIKIGTDDTEYKYVDKIRISDTIVAVGNTIDIQSFEFIEGSDRFYIDKNAIYAHQQFPATWPVIKRLELDVDDATIFDINYIKDRKNVYFAGIYLSSRSPFFDNIPNRDKKAIYADGKKMFWNWSEMGYQDFKETNFSVSKDSLKRIYFPK
ncbi:MAG: hypothetical protein OIF50_11720 [Flavobacteriaceae bacterium]|nr:hypothetical protein [Flavobacteriaceae bacterium]